MLVRIVATAVCGLLGCTSGNDAAPSAEATNAKNSTPEDDVPAANLADAGSTAAIDAQDEALQSDAPAAPGSNGAQGDSIGDDSPAESVPGGTTGADTDPSAPASSSDATRDGPETSILPPLPQAEGPGYAFARGGTRLGAVHYTAPGVEQFLHFYDHELATKCAFEKIAGHSDYACAPPVTVDVQYLDAGCTQPIVLTWQGGIAAPRPEEFDSRVVPVPESFVGGLVTVRNTDADCSTERALRSSGAAVTAPGSELPLLGEVKAVYQVSGDKFTLPTEEGSSLPTVYKLEDGVCESTFAMVRVRTAADGAYPLELRSVAELVTAEVQSFDAGAGFGIQRLIGTDGSWQTLGPLDYGREPCELLEDGRCVPGPVEPLFRFELFADWPCAGDRVAVFTSDTYPCGDRFGVATTDGELRVFNLVASEDSGYYTQHERINPDTGEPLGPECSGLAAMVVGAGLADREFATAEVALSGGPELRSRTRVTHSALNAVSLSRDIDFVLEDYSVCQVTLFDDGVYRCHTATPGVLDGVTYLPENQAQPLGLYADDACTNEIYIEQAGANPDAPFWILTTSFHALVPFEGVIHEDTGGGCYPVPQTSIEGRTFIESAELPIALPVVEKVEL